MQTTGGRRLPEQKCAFRLRDRVERIGASETLSRNSIPSRLSPAQHTKALSPLKKGIKGALLFSALAKSPLPPFVKGGRFFPALWGGRQKAQGPLRGAGLVRGATRSDAQGSSGLDVGSLLALRSGGDFEAHALTFFEGLEAGHVDRGEMSEQIFALFIRRDEPETLGLVEPFDRTSCH